VGAGNLHFFRLQFRAKVSRLKRSDALEEKKSNKRKQTEYGGEVDVSIISSSSSIAEHGFPAQLPLSWHQGV
jgi:hypothetical protein